ncbi:MAG TPA: histidinol-phosphate aminotransferase family protein [Pyrodictium sp.]|nr:histidinol-phosphate aminotransferase family protein [Pyrodictium sp.]
MWGMAWPMRSHGGSPPPCCHDFSAPFNPLGPPPWLGEVLEECIGEKVYLRYPHHNYHELRDAITMFHGVEQEEIVVSNGAAEALVLLPLFLRVKRLVVAEPGFGDHAVQAPAAGLELVRVVMPRNGAKGFTLDADSIVKAVGERAVVVISRPNNPTGYLAPRDLIVDAAWRLAAKGSWLIVDEAFIDLSPKAKPLEPSEGLIVVRSLTKTFATPGLRLGYVHAERRLARRLDAARQPWPVGSLTACAYTRLLTDKRSRDYVQRGRSIVEEEAQRIQRAMERIGLRAYPTRAPFILVEHSQLPHPLMQRKLMSHGVYVRDASSFYGLGPGYSRVSIRTPGENDVLLRALESVLNG